MTSPHMPPRRGREPKTPRQTNEKAPVSDEQPEQAHPDRPTSTKPLDDDYWRDVEQGACHRCGQTGLHACPAEHRRLINLAESHAHEADRLAGTQAGNTHAQIALVYATLAGQEPR